MRSSEPQMLGRPSRYSGSSCCVILSTLSICADCWDITLRLRCRTDVMINVQVMLCRMVPRKVVVHAVQHQVAELFGIAVPQADGAEEGRFDRPYVGLVEHVTVALVVWFVGVVAIENRVCQAANGAHDRYGAVL